MDLDGFVFTEEDRVPRVGEYYVGPRGNVIGPAISGHGSVQNEIERAIVVPREARRGFVEVERLIFIGGVDYSEAEARQLLRELEEALS